MECGSITNENSNISKRTNPRGGGKAQERNTSCCVCYDWRECRAGEGRYSNGASLPVSYRESPPQNGDIYAARAETSTAMKRLRRSSSGSGMLHDVAVAFQRLDPAGCILIHIRRCVNKPRVVIRLVAGEHEVNRTNQFMGDLHNGFLVTTPNHEPPVFLAKYRQCAYSPILGLAQQITQNRIAFAGLAAFACPRSHGCRGTAPPGARQGSCRLCHVANG